MVKQLTLVSIFDGALQEKVDRALAKVAENILDENTSQDVKRTITIKLTLVPSKDDREDVAIGAEVSCGLAPEMVATSELYIRKGYADGRITVAEHRHGAIKGQLDIWDYAGIDPEEDADEETGEVFPRPQAMAGPQAVVS